MHRLPSESILACFRIASLLIVLVRLAFAGGAGLLVTGLVTTEHEWLRWAAVAVVSGLAFILAGFFVGGRARCPLCMMPPLRNQSCSKHRNAGKVLGSFKLSVALSVLFQNRFRCPYCGEPTAMEVRARPKMGR